MKKALWVWLFAVLSVAALAQTKINPVTQLRWPLITGAGTPGSFYIGCNSTNYGQPYQNTAVTPNTYYTCGTDGWVVRSSTGSGLTSFQGRTTAAAVLQLADVTGLGTLSNNTTGNAATATGLAAAPSQCASGLYSTGIAASGAANCGSALNNVSIGLLGQAAGAFSALSLPSQASTYCLHVLTTGLISPIASDCAPVVSPAFTGGFQATSGSVTLVLSNTGLVVQTPGGDVAFDGPFVVASATAATSGANSNSPPSSLIAYYWNGTASTMDAWAAENVLGTGTTPTSTLAFTHTGSSGATAMTVNGVGVCLQSGSGCSYLGGALNTSSGAGTFTVLSGAGTGATGFATGYDGSGAFSLTTGTSPAASAQLFTVTFTASRGHNAFCTITPESASSAALTGTQQVYIPGASSTSVTLNAGSTALAASTQYGWNFTCL